MNHSSERIASLIFKHLGEETLSEVERAELNAWKAASLENEALLSRYSSEEGLRQAILSHQEAKDRHWAYIQATIAQQQAAMAGEVYEEPVVVRRMFGWQRIAVAASIALLLAAGTYFTFFHRSSSNAGQPVVTGPYQNDVDPGKEKAYLVLADGKKVALEDAPNGVLAQQGSVSIAKQNGVVSYNNTGDAAGDVAINKLVVPRGGKFQLLLPDGSHVWVNSASTLEYPTVFDDSKRLVKLDGEAYFEISHVTSSSTGKRIPFMVSVNGSEVEVLGTHFNIMGYANEPSINTTLLAGSVRVVKGDHQKILTPGQQGRVDQQGKLTVLSSVDTEEVLAWKNGRFQFARVSLDVIMRQLERWYDVEVEYKDKIPDVFVGGIERDVQVSQILKLLELTELVHFNIEGKKIIVMQGKKP